MENKNDVEIKYNALMDLFLESESANSAPLTTIFAGTNLNIVIDLIERLPIDDNDFEFLPPLLNLVFSEPFYDKYLKDQKINISEKLFLKLERLNILENTDICCRHSLSEFTRNTLFNLANVSENFILNHIEDFCLDYDFLKNRYPNYNLTSLKLYKELELPDKKLYSLKSLNHTVRDISIYSAKEIASCPEKLETEYFLNEGMDSLIDVVVKNKSLFNENFDPDFRQLDLNYGIYILPFSFVKAKMSMFIFCIKCYMRANVKISKELKDAVYDNYHNKKCDELVELYNFDFISAALFIFLSSLFSPVDYFGNKYQRYSKYLCKELESLNININIEEVKKFSNDMVAAYFSLGLDEQSNVNLLHIYKKYKIFPEEKK